MLLLEYASFRRQADLSRLQTRLRTLIRILFQMPSLEVDCTSQSGPLAIQPPKVVERDKSVPLEKYGSGYGPLTILVLAFKAVDEISLELEAPFACLVSSDTHRRNVTTSWSIMSSEKRYLN